MILKGQPSAKEKLRVRQDALQPSKEELASFSTIELVNELKSSTLNVNVLLGGTPHGGMQYFRDTHYGVNEFLVRSDFHIILMETYKNDSESIGNRENEANHVFEFTAMEMLMLIPEFQDKLENDDARKEVISLILTSLENRWEYMATHTEKPLYSKGGIKYPAKTIASLLEVLNHPEYIRWMNSKERGLFTKHGLNQAESEEIFAMAHSLVEQ